MNHHPAQHQKFITSVPEKKCPWHEYKNQPIWKAKNIINKIKGLQLQITIALHNGI